jgi:hypothetical protein
MLHYSLHARGNLWLFHTWGEARALWDRLTAVAPLHHLCLMPDHVHLLASTVDTVRLGGALSGYARWLAHHRAEPVSRLWARPRPPREIPNQEHLDRTRRYVLLNPCRGCLVSDPLAWPFSTHRDALGFAWPRARRLVQDRAGFHSYVSKDETASPEGTGLPIPNLREPTFVDIEQAVSAVLRFPLERLRIEPAPRAALIRCARVLTPLSARAIAREVSCVPSTVTRVEASRDSLVIAVEAVALDARFPGLGSEDLRWTPAGRRYAAYVAAKRRARSSGAER